MNFEFDIEKVIRMFLPSFLRKKARIIFLTKLMSYFEAIHGEFLRFFKKTKMEMQWDGRKGLLERHLNLKFGQGIKIINQEFGNRPLFMADAPDEQNILSFDAPNYSNLRDGDTAAFVADAGFIVEVPLALSLDLNEVRAYVNMYLIGYVTYKIVEV